MSPYKDKDFDERLKAAANAKKAMLERFRAVHALLPDVFTLKVFHARYRLGRGCIPCGGRRCSL